MRIFLGVMALAALVAVPAPGARAADCAGSYVGDAAGDANVAAASYREAGELLFDLPNAPLPPTSPASDARGDLTGVCISRADGYVTVRFDVATGVQKASDPTGRTFLARIKHPNRCRYLDAFYRWGSGDSAKVIIERDWGPLCESGAPEYLNEPTGRAVQGVTFSHAKGSTEFFVSFPATAVDQRTPWLHRAISVLHTEVGPYSPPGVYHAPIDFVSRY